MKKGLYILSLLLLSLPMWAQESEEAKGAHPYKVEENENIPPEFAHWSIIPHIGFSSFDGDFTSEAKHTVAVPAAGLALEYNFTPVWSLGIEYMYDMYTVTGATGHADTLLTGHMHKAGGYLSMDLISLIFPRAKKKILSVIPYVGGGVAFYRRTKYHMDDYYVDPRTGIEYNPTHKRGNTASYINADGEVAPERDKGYKSIGYLQTGVNVEFNLNRTLALGVRANYAYFTRDYVDGRGYHPYSPSSFASKNNDGIFDVTLNMRIKFESQSKNHVRNISAFDTWEKKVEQKPCHDTVILRRDSIIIRETLRQFEKEREQDKYYYVYFAKGKSDIDNEGLITIQQVAERLQEDTTLYAIVTGYCDNTGSNSFNYALGDRRADNVVEELAQEHGIEMERMHAGGMGKVIARRSTTSYGPNRRAAIRLVDKETFDRMKNNLDDQKANRPEVEKTVPLTESSRLEKVNTYQQRGGEEVTVTKNITLAKLARQYYNNTYCWVYIYIANKEKISNPNALLPGTKLNIPELTAKEMQITKDESLVLFSNARQKK